jgi:hypothetical protein
MGKAVTLSFYMCCRRRVIIESCDLAVVRKFEVIFMTHAQAQQSKDNISGKKRRVRHRA